METTKSQNEEILKWLQSGKSLTPLEALEKFGSFRLGARVYELKKEGHNIRTDIVESKGKRFASYVLVKP
jgi:hypothetical protein